MSPRLLSSVSLFLLLTWLLLLLLLLHSTTEIELSAADYCRSVTPTAVAAAAPIIPGL